MLVSFDGHYPGCPDNVGIPCTRYVSAHIPSPYKRQSCLAARHPAGGYSAVLSDILSCESRSQSTMDVSDSLYAFSLPRLFLSGLPVEHDILPECIGPAEPCEVPIASGLRISSSSSTHFRGCIQVHGCHPSNHPSGSDYIGMFSSRPGLRIRSHVSLWSVKFPVYTSSVSFFVSVLGNPVLRKGTESQYLRESNTRY